MKLIVIYLLAAASIVSFCFFTTATASNMDADFTVASEIDLPLTLKSAIDNANERKGTDSIYLSEFKTEYVPDQYLISDHLVLVNDMLTVTDLFAKDVSFTIATSGNLELIGFDLKTMESNIINRGAIKLFNCQFQEGKDLTKLITNQGAFDIVNGLFKGSPEGEIIRDASFSFGARLIL